MSMLKNKPFIVAEVSANHGGSIINAYALIDAAVNAGADAVKFQLYTADEMTILSIKKDFELDHGKWKGRTLYALYKAGETPRSWFPKLFEYARKKEIIAFSSVFSKDGVDFLEKLHCPIYKISSFEITDIPLIEYVVATRKPVIISTGIATNEESLDAFSVARDAYFLYCISDYPAKPMSLRTFSDHGISDHSLSVTLPALAVMKGAIIIEKHLTLSRGIGGLDDSFSLEPDEFKLMVKNVREAWDILMGPPPKESPYTHLKRSLYVVEDIKEGELFTEKNIRAIRPGHGLPPKHLKEFLGERAANNMKRGTPLTW